MIEVPFRIGVIGCGNISDIYFKNARLFPETLRIVACADLVADTARQKAHTYQVRALSSEDLLASDEIDIVLNLTVPSAHATVSSQAIACGKHVYSEKPLSLSVADAQKLSENATNSGILIACAPDTILGASHQAARAAIDTGLIGEVVSAHAAIMDRGMEHWHPNPSFFYQSGGGPVFDMGPYYIALLVNILGPVVGVTAQSSIGIKDRLIQHGPLRGKPIDITVPTTIHALLQFSIGSNVVFSASWDVWSHSIPHIELYGTEGTLTLPDPNWFGGTPLLSKCGGPANPLTLSDFAFGTPNRLLSDGSQVADYRIIGLVDMCHALADKRTPRLSVDFGRHIVEILEAINGSASGASVHRLCFSTSRPNALTSCEAEAWR